MVSVLTYNKGPVRVAGVLHAPVAAPYADVVLVSRTIIPNSDSNRCEESVAEYPSLLDYSKGDPICHPLTLGPEEDACDSVPSESSGTICMRRDLVPEAEPRCGGEKRDTTRFAHLSIMERECGTPQSLRGSPGRERDPAAHMDTLGPNKDEEHALLNRLSVGEATDARSNSEWHPGNGVLDDEVCNEKRRERLRADDTPHPENCTAGRSDRHPRKISSDDAYAATVARVDTRRSPRTTPPGEVSMTAPFGPASRWGELSKAHLEFHRLSTAGKPEEHNFTSGGEGTKAMFHLFRVTGKDQGKTVSRRLESRNRRNLVISVEACTLLLVCPGGGGCEGIIFEVRRY